MSPDAELGRAVRAARTRSKTTLRALAARIGVSPATLSQIENGHTGLSEERLARIAAALGTTVTAVLAPQDPAGEPDAVVAPPYAEDAVEVAWRDYEPLDFDPVLQAALEEFLTVGYHGATVRTIAARAGLSVAGIYHHYTSKQQLLVTILELTMAELLARARGAQAEGRDPVERFGLHIENLALFHTCRRELGFVGAAEMRSLEPANHARIAELRTTQQRLVDQEAAAAALAGRFGTAHPREAARAAVTMCTALATWWRPGGALSPQALAEQYVDFALAMVRLDA